MNAELKGYEAAMKKLGAHGRAPRTCTPPRNVQQKFPMTWKTYIQGWARAIREAEQEMTTR